MSIPCPGCEGAGCDNCDDSGEIDITVCPLMIITSDVREVIKYVDLVKSLPPVAGGALDQAKVFIDAMDFIMNEEQMWKNKLGIFS